MTGSLCHPALPKLLTLQWRGRVRRMTQRLCTPRRMVLSIVAALLGAVWIGNAILTIWLREPAQPHVLRAMFALGLGLYAAWHFAKAACFRPTQPLEWIERERELLASLPLRSSDLVSYKLASVTTTTLLKSALCGMLLVPDLVNVWAGLVGITLALFALEMIRLVVEIATWGMSDRAFRCFRGVVIAAMIALGLAALHGLTTDGIFSAAAAVGGGVLDRVVDGVSSVYASPVGWFAIAFWPFVQLVCVDGGPASLMLWATVAIAQVVALTAVAYGLHRYFTRRHCEAERSEYATRLHDAAANNVTTDDGRPVDAGMASSLPRVWHIRGAGPIAWRQIKGAWRHRGSLLTALVAPAVLTATPLLVIADAHDAFLSATGVLVFYTFLLLPTALKFDFRRDLDHYALLKSLPISPVATSVGQVATPVIIATGFQLVVLIACALAKWLPVAYPLAAMAVLVPLNVCIFALDSVIYLLYPYRHEQEGLEIFLRTMLTFTGKGLLFTGGILALSLWGYAAAMVAHRLQLDGYLVFVAGLSLGLAAMAAIVIAAAARAYNRLDPVEDVPR